MPNEFIARNGITSLGNIIVSGSITSTGAINMSGSIASASFATTAATASFVTLAQTASFVANAQSASNAVTAQTASYANSLTVAGTLTAQTLVVQTITSSVDFVTGSTRFGSIISNTHQFTGSVGISGSLSGTSATFSGNLNLQAGVTRNINFYDSSNTNINAQIQYDQISSNSGQLFFGTNNAGTFATRLTIASTGAATFSSSVTATQFTSQGGRGTSYGYKLPDWQIYNTTSGNALAFSNYTNDLLYITSGGNIGIGTTTPNFSAGAAGSTVLTISATSSGRNGLIELNGTRTNADDFVSYIRFFNNAAATPLADIYALRGSSDVSGSLVIATSGTERMRISSGGQVGIKITPNSGWGGAMAALQVGTGGVVSNWTGANNNLNVGVNFYDNGAGSQLRLYTGGTSTIGFSEDTITFNSAASSTAGSTITFVERMRISGGNVRIVNVGSQLQFDTDGSGGSTTLGTNGQYDFRIYNGRGGASNIDVSTYEIVFGMNGSTNRYRMGSGAFYPAGDNAYSCGASGQRWTAIWAANGTIQTSDARQKKDITDSNLGLEFINKLRPVSYKWKVGKNVVTTDGERIDENGATQSNDIITPVAGVRTHYGLIAQEVKEVLGDTDFGGYVYDEDTDTMALRYDQFISPMIKAIQELKAQNDALTTRIEQLEQQ